MAQPCTGARCAYSPLELHHGVPRWGARPSEALRWRWVLSALPARSPGTRLVKGYRVLSPGRAHRDGLRHPLDPTRSSASCEGSRGAHSGHPGGPAPTPPVRSPEQRVSGSVAFQAQVHGRAASLDGDRVGGAGGCVPADERSGPPESGAPLAERRFRRVGDGAGRRDAPPGDRTHPPRARASGCSCPTPSTAGRACRGARRRRG